MKTVKTISFLIAGITAMLFVQSCAMMTVRGHHTILSESSSHSLADVQITTPMFGSPFHINFMLGAGHVNISEADHHASGTGISLGIGGSYHLSFKRLQPYIGLDFTDVVMTGIADKKNDKATTDDKKLYYHLTPHVGLRYYLSNRVAINGSLGYQVGWYEFEQNNISYKRTFSGIAPTVGITFVLSTKRMSKR